MTFDETQEPTGSADDDTGTLVLLLRFDEQKTMHGFGRVGCMHEG